MVLDGPGLRLVDLEAFGQEQPLRFEAFPLQSTLQDFVEHALVQGVLIDDDETVVGLLDDVAVVDLQVLAVLKLARRERDWRGAGWVDRRSFEVPVVAGRCAFRVQIELRLLVDRPMSLEELGHRVGDLLSSQFLSTPSSSPGGDSRTGNWAAMFRFVPSSRSRRTPRTCE